MQVRTVGSGIVITVLTFPLLATSLVPSARWVGYPSSSSQHFTGTTKKVMTSKVWMVAKDENDTDNDTRIDISSAQYGVSYIGGDPCGSKYNNDPFDVQVQKPGMPDSMKARIQALVDKKVAEEKAQQLLLLQQQQQQNERQA